MEPLLKESPFDGAAVEEAIGLLELLEIDLVEEDVVVDGDDDLKGLRGSVEGTVHDLSHEAIYE